jgi:hypothetical protein
MRKNYVSTFDGTLSSLSAPARTIYLLILKIKAHQDNRYCKKDQFFHSVEKFVEISGYKNRAVKYALQELRDIKVLDWIERPGRSTLYTHIKYITIFNPCKPCTTVVHLMHPTHAPNAPITTKDLTNKDLTTTWLDDQLRDKLIKSHGEQAVNDRVVVISKMNGNVKNKAGLLVDSLKRGYMPASKELREKEEKERKNELIQARIETEKLEREKMLKDFSENSSGQIDLVGQFEQMIKINGES